MPRCYKLEEIDFYGACAVGKQAQYLVIEMGRKGITLTTTEAVNMIESDPRAMGMILEAVRQRRGKVGAKGNGSFPRKEQHG